MTTRSHCRAARQQLRLMATNGLSLLGRGALAYARRGRAVFPLVPRGKAPMTKNGCKDATTNQEQVAAWWRWWPEANIGCATGAPSGFWSLDVDGLDGEETLRELERANGPLPPTIELITGGGRQLFFVADDRVRNSVRRLGAGLDTRSTGGYTILPPSVHPTGRAYQWSVDGHPSEVRITPAPTWLIDMLAQPQSGLSAAQEDWRRLIAEGVSEGSRNDAIARLSGHLLRHFIDPVATLHLMLAWNAAACRPPLPDQEVAAVVNSIAKAEARRRQAHAA